MTIAGRPARSQPPIPPQPALGRHGRPQTGDAGPAATNARRLVERTRLRATDREITPDAGAVGPRLRHLQQPPSLLGHRARLPRPRLRAPRRRTGGYWG